MSNLWFFRLRRAEQQRRRSSGEQSAGSTSVHSVASLVACGSSNAVCQTSNETGSFGNAAHLATASSSKQLHRIDRDWDLLGEAGYGDGVGPSIYRGRSHSEEMRRNVIMPVLDESNPLSDCALFSNNNNDQQQQQQQAIYRHNQQQRRLHSVHELSELRASKQQEKEDNSNFGNSFVPKPSTSAPIECIDGSKSEHKARNAHNKQSATGLLKQDTSSSCDDTSSSLVPSAESSRNCSPSSTSSTSSISLLSLGKSPVDVVVGKTHGFCRPRSRTLVKQANLNDAEMKISAQKATNLKQNEQQQQFQQNISSKKLHWTCSQMATTSNNNNTNTTSTSTFNMEKNGKMNKQTRTSKLQDTDYNKKRNLTTSTKSKRKMQEMAIQCDTKNKKFVNKTTTSKHYHKIEASDLCCNERNAKLQQTCIDFSNQNYNINNKSTNETSSMNNNNRTGFIVPQVTIIRSDSTSSFIPLSPSVTDEQLSTTTTTPTNNTFVSTAKITTSAISQRQLQQQTYAVPSDLSGQKSNAIEKACATDSSTPFNGFIQCNDNDNDNKWQPQLISRIIMTNSGSKIESQLMRDQANNNDNVFTYDLPVPNNNNKLPLESQQSVDSATTTTTFSDHSDAHVRAQLISGQVPPIVHKSARRNRSSRLLSPDSATTTPNLNSTSFNNNDNSDDHGLVGQLGQFADSIDNLASLIPR